MSSTAPVLVERLYRHLIDAAAERLSAGSEFTIGDLYQQLIPYRGVRGELGILELAEYEHALLRLLAGEGGFVRLADDNARREFLAELAAPNPILGIYRDYAGVIVAVPEHDATASAGQHAPPSPRGGSPSRSLDGGGPPLAPAPTAADALRVPAPATTPASHGLGSLGTRPFGSSPSSAEGSAASGVAGISGSGAAGQETTSPATATAAADGHAELRRAAAGSDDANRSAVGGNGKVSCIACNEPLPDRPDVRFCPHCGVDQSAIPCAACRTPILAAWNFCIHCGARRPQPARRPS